MNESTKIAASQQQFLVAFGANLPSAAGGVSETLRAGVVALSRSGLRLRALSRFFATPAFPKGSGPDFVNAAAVFTTELSPDVVLDRCHVAEGTFGRERHTRWAARTLDIDILANGARVLPDIGRYRQFAKLDLEEQQRIAPDRLILPHPRLQDRAFVLGPLRDVASEWVHPVLGLTIEEMWRRLPDAERAEIRPI